ncbi:tRNA uridine(34) 5-carboxymethylaminomethyl modification radical SAM/GNAT enzyme Elp3 [Candidatus Dojkabacteria bacterium]|nr:tRNA uridine(34) 5-carboxymethylaminomethyl modification radical SAM/GNAT enzyme Elp3 [Candidatus Dojkabacteria bacterium]
MKNFAFDPKLYKCELVDILQEVGSNNHWRKDTLSKILRKYPKDNNGLFSYDQLIVGYRYLISEKSMKYQKLIFDRIQRKPTRSISGVTTVSLLTKPYPCPGQCIFCPNEKDLPKSYLKKEPGAQRALANKFDAYNQVYRRLKALHSTGHNTDKIEIIILGGSWSAYPRNYQLSFIYDIFKALNNFSPNQKDIEIKDQEERRTKSSTTKSKNQITLTDLYRQQKINETAHSRCIGLSVETRPDLITEQEIIKIRQLGATKIQIGIQSLDNEILKRNRRGHTIFQTQKAFKLLRLAGFKIHAHWMPNLYTSTPQKDIEDYKNLWTRKYHPDELKIYPTSIIENTILNKLFHENKYKPYTERQLLKVIKECMKNTPRYCRLTRVIRDIPSQNIVSGNKKTNFRQVVENSLKKEKTPCQCIRCREIRDQQFQHNDIDKEIIKYQTDISTEFFISIKTKSSDKIIAFLRLSIPLRKVSNKNFIKELRNSSIIREVHVYGQAEEIGQKDQQKAQHQGLGTQLIKIAEELTKENDYSKISVISAIGTKKYYEKRGFRPIGLYMQKIIDS